MTTAPTSNAEIVSGIYAAMAAADIELLLAMCSDELTIDQAEFYIDTPAMLAALDA